MAMNAANDGAVLANGLKRRIRIGEKRAPSKRDRDGH